MYVPTQQHSVELCLVQQQCCYQCYNDDPNILFGIVNDDNTCCSWLTLSSLSPTTTIMVATSQFRLHNVPFMLFSFVVLMISLESIVHAVSSALGDAGGGNGCADLKRQAGRRPQQQQSRRYHQDGIDSNDGSNDDNDDDDSQHGDDGGSSSGNNHHSRSRSSAWTMVDHHDVIWTFLSFLFGHEDDDTTSLSMSSSSSSSVLDEEEAENEENSFRRSGEDEDGGGSRAFPNRWIRRFCCEHTTNFISHKFRLACIHHSLQPDKPLHLWRKECRNKMMTMVKNHNDDTDQNSNNDDRGGDGVKAVESCFCYCCPICLSDLKDDDRVTAPVRRCCHHVFHRDCLVQWLVVSTTQQEQRRDGSIDDIFSDSCQSSCPCCRQKILLSYEELPHELGSRHLRRT